MISTPGNTKSEARNPKQIRSTKFKTWAAGKSAAIPAADLPAAGVLNICIWIFEFVSDFGIRYSDLWTFRRLDGGKDTWV
jgi:hypothetical protein